MGRTSATSSITYHKGYAYDKVRISVLAISKLTKEQREAIRATIKTLTSGEAAEALVFTHFPKLEKHGHELGWSFQWLDQMKKVGVLKNKGIEVATFFKRQVITEEPAPGDPLPEGVLKEPEDVWQRLDLLGPSARQANLFIKNQQERMEAEIGVLNQNLNAKQVIADDAETRMLKAQDELEAAIKRSNQLQEKITVISQHVPSAKIRKWMEAHQQEKDMQRKRKERAEARNKKVIQEAANIRRKKEDARRRKLLAMRKKNKKKGKP